MDIIKKQLNTYKIADIVNDIENFAPIIYQESYDNSGLQIGDLSSEFKGVLFTLDITEEVIDEAIDNGCNMIISHHPLIFSPIKRLIGSDRVEKSIIKAIKNNISIYCSHTCSDAVKGGVSWALANKLGVVDCTVLEPANGNEEIGFGVIGHLEEAMTSTHFYSWLKEVLNLKHIRYTKPTGNYINKLALCGGSGAFLTKKAKDLGCDVLISADFKYHDFFEAENSISLVDIGHYESEIYILDIFFDIITKKYNNFVVLKSKINSNPILYL